MQQHTQQFFLVHSNGMELDAIAGVVVGGTLFAGGVGSVVVQLLGYSPCLS